MRKTAFPAALGLAMVVTALAVSCGGGEWDDTVVTNNSTFTVEFKFRHTGEFTLQPGASATFASEGYQHIEWFRDDFDHAEDCSEPAPRVRFGNEDGRLGGAFGDFWDIYPAPEPCCFPEPEPEPEP